MMTKIYNRRLKAKSENGQSMLEFVLVLPVFALMLFMILDFGWLFYNYINVENSARNAARIACVEYKYVCLDDSGALDSPHIYYVDDIDAEGTSEQENDILSQVKSSLTDPDNIKKITVSYSADTDTTRTIEERTPENRYYGDVTVSVEYEIPVFTPVLGVVSDHMKMTLHSTSTFKVEKSDDS